MKKEVYYLDNNYVIASAKFKYGSVRAFCKHIGISRVRFYEALRYGYKSENTPLIEKFVRELELNRSLLWKEM